MRNTTSIRGRRANLWDRTITAAGLTAFVVVVVGVILMLSVLLPRMRPDTVTRIGQSESWVDTADAVWAAVPPVDREIAVGRLRVGPLRVLVDEQGHATLRFRFDPANYDWGQDAAVAMVATGSTGSRAEFRVNQAWPDPPAPHPLGYTGWRSELDAVARRDARQLDLITRLEQHEGERDTLESVRAELEADRAGRAADGVCPADGKPIILSYETNALGDRTFLGCNFQPGEQVTAELTFDLLGTRP